MLTITPEVRAVIEHCERFTPSRPSRVLIDATAGSGKTTTLTLIHRSLNARGKNVLPLAFSRRGVQRYAKLASENAPEAVSCMGTSLCVSLDSLAAHIIKFYAVNNNWKKGRIEAEFDDSSLSRTLMAKVVASINGSLIDYETKEEVPLIPAMEHDLTEHLELVSNIKISLAFEADPFSRLKDDYEMDDADEVEIGWALDEIGLPSWSFRLFHAYEKLRRSYNLMEVEDYVYDLRSEPQAIYSFCRDRSIDVALIDEHHDTKPAHFKFIEHLIRAGVSVVAVGDASQDLFEFRGIRPFNSNVAFYEAGAKVFALSSTYRFGLPLADEIQKMFRHMPREVGIQPASHTTTIDFAGDEAKTIGMAAATVNRIVAAKKIEMDASQIAVIFPSAQNSFATQCALIKENVPYQCEAIQPYHLANEGLFFRALVRLAGWCNQPYTIQDAMALELIVELPRCKFNRGQILSLWGDLMTLTERGRPLFAKDRVYKLDCIDSVMVEIREHLKLLGTIEFFPENIAKLSDRLGIHQWVTDKAPSAAARSSTKAALSHFSGQLTKLGADGYISLLEQASGHFAKGFSAKKVRLTSVLQSKGDDWAVVVLSGHWKRDHLTDLQKRSLYVAATRAKSRLIGLGHSAFA